MRILICGDRNWTNKALIRAEIAQYIGKLECIIEGKARGADRFAGDIAHEYGIKLLEFPANWEKYGKAAGPIRNQQMLNEGKPDLVLAFHNNIEESKGTKHMINISKKAGINVILITE